MQSNATSLRDGQSSAFRAAPLWLLLVSGVLGLACGSEGDIPLEQAMAGSSAAGPANVAGQASGSGGAVSVNAGGKGPSAIVAAGQPSGGSSAAPGGSPGAGNGGAGAGSGGAGAGNLAAGAGSGGAGAGSGGAGAGGPAGGSAASNGGASGGGTAMAGAGAGIPPGTVPIFVAQGHMGRTTVSCDDGKTWVANASADDSVRCFDPVDCDHNASAGRGLAYGNGWFVATFGWGTPGHIKRSRDGVSWETVAQDAEFADVAFGNGTFVANDHTPQLSGDGTAWKPGGSTNMSIWTMRAIEFVPYQTGRFIITGEVVPTREIAVSADNGKTWRSPTSSPPQCVERVRGIAFGNGITIAASGAGSACRSSDGGDTWSLVNVTKGAELTSAPLWDGRRFLVWGASAQYSSADGITWSSTPGTPASAQIGPVARSPDGTFVASRDWDFYDRQEFYRSTDGLNWVSLEKTKFVPSHPIRFIQFGYAAPSSACPAR